jgi:hypothetical protein
LGLLSPFSSSGKRINGWICCENGRLIHLGYCKRKEFELFVGAIIQPVAKTEDTTQSNINVHPLQETEVSSAAAVMRLAFGTFIGLPEPMSFMGDAAYIRNRWLAHPEAAFAAAVDEQVIGSNLATNWGSVGFFRPLTVRPDYWDRGVAKP